MLYRLFWNGAPRRALSRHRIAGSGLQNNLPEIAVFMAAK
jgi:hypothetical protein